MHNYFILLCCIATLDAFAYYCFTGDPYGLHIAALNLGFTKAHA